MIPQSDLQVSIFPDASGHYWTVSDRTGPLRNMSKEIGSDRQWNVCLRWHPDSVTYRWFLPADLTQQWSTTSTHCRQSCCCLADVIRHIEAYETLHYIESLVIFILPRIKTKLETKATKLVLTDPRTARSASMWIVTATIAAGAATSTLVLRTRMQHTMRAVEHDWLVNRSRFNATNGNRKNRPLHIACVRNVFSSFKKWK